MWLSQYGGVEVAINWNLLNDFDRQYTLPKQGGRKMKDNLLLNPKEFKIDETIVNGKRGSIYCKRLIEKWTPQLESEMLEAFIHLYYDDMYKNWGPDDEEESKEYWPEISAPSHKIHRHKCYTLCFRRRSIWIWQRQLVWATSACMCSIAIELSMGRRTWLGCCFYRRKIC